MPANANIPYWRLSSFYFFYFSFVGVLSPFWNLYLEQELLFSAQEIGLITAAMMSSRIIGPFFWGWLADHFNQRLRIIRCGAFLAAMSFVTVFIEQSFYWLLSAVFLYSFFWNAILSQFEVVTLSHLGHASVFYSRIRLWGSMGFILAVLGLGFVFDHIALAHLPQVLLLLLLMIWVASLTVPKPEESVLPPTSEPDKDVAQARFAAFKQQLLQPTVLSFLFISFLMQLSHGPYYTFFSIYLEQLAYSRTLIGFLWALGVVAEVFLFIVMHHVMRYCSLRRLLLITLFLTALRWFMLGLWADIVWLLLLAQLLHAASFASFHALSMEFIHQNFTHESKGQGQASYSALSYGIGGALGALGSGYLWEQGASLLFILAGMAITLAFVVACFYKNKDLSNPC